MKRLISFFLSLVILLSVSSGFCFATDALSANSDFQYTVLDDGTAEISKYTGSSTEVVIPQIIDGYTVTSIGENAFFYASNIVSVSLPDTITQIQSSAFYLCMKISSLTIPESVKYIGAYAFYGCKSWFDISIPDGVEHISFYAFNNTGVYRDDAYWDGDALYIDNCLVDTKETMSGDYSIKVGTRLISDWIFYKCASLNSVAIPASVEGIGSKSFLPDCQVTIDENNPCYIMDNNVLFNKEKTLLIQYFNSNPAEYTVPESVVEIGDYAFNECKNLVRVVIPDSVKIINDYAFYQCKALVGVSLSEGLECIDTGAFSQCILLEDVQIPSTVTYIGGSAFYYCESIVSIKVPDGITVLNKSVFCGCDNLTNIILPDSLKEIGIYALSSCFSLAHVDIPCGVTKIEYGAFQYDKMLEEIEIPKTVISIDSDAFRCCDLLKSFELPKGLKVIRENVFSDDKNLQSVIIPNTVTTIERYAFYKCESLKDVYFLGTEEQWNNIEINDQDKSNKYLLNASMHFIPQKCTVTVSDSSLGTATFNGQDVIFSPVTMNVEENSDIVLTATPVEGAEFVGWSVNGEIVSDSPSVTLKAVGDITYVPIFREICERVFTVAFAEKYGNIFSVQTVSDATEIEMPSPPEIPGFKFIGWSLTEMQIAELTSSAVIQALYEKTSQQLYTVNAEYSLITAAGKQMQNSMSGIAYNTYVTVYAESADAWSINGAVVAYGDTYSFYVGSDVTIVPLFGSIVPVPTIAAVSVTEVQEDNQRSVSFLATRTMTDDCTFLSAGYIYGKNLEYDEITLEDVDGVSVKTEYCETDAEQFSLKYTLDDYSGRITARAFLIYMNAKGEMNILYAVPQTYAY